MKEKKLTPAEIKKRDEIAKAMKKDDPDMPMDKKMAIATATAKRVAEGKMKQAMMRRQDMAKLAGLYSKAMKAMPGSPEQKKIKKQIDQYRRELGMNESTEYLEEATDLYNKGGIQIVRFSAGKGKVGVEITVKKGNSPSEIGGQIVLSDTQFKNLQRALPRINLKKGLGESLEEGLKTTHVLINTADGNKIVSTAAGANAEKNLRSSIASAERPPMNIKDKKTLKIVKLKKPVSDKKASQMIGDPLKEAVSPAQQAAIAISKKERGEKPKTECADEKDFKPHMMYDPKTGKGVMAKKYEDHVKLDKMGYVHDKPEVKENYRTLATKGMGAEEKGKVKVGDEVDFYETERGDKLVGRVIKVTNLGYTVQSLSRENKGKKYTFKYHDRAKAKKLLESRAYRDAMRGMSARGATRGMARTKKDKDIEATDDDRKAASKNIIMQLRKAADLPKGADVEFDRGKGKVTRDQAKAALARFNALSKPNEKEKFQKSIKSLADIKKLLGR